MYISSNRTIDKQRQGKEVGEDIGNSGYLSIVRINLQLPLF